MNHCVIVGAGAVGFAAASLLLRSRSATRVTLVDRRPEALQRAAERIAGSQQLQTVLLDLEGATERVLDDCLAGASVLLCVVGWEVSEPIFRACLAHRVPVVTVDRPEYEAVPALAARFRDQGSRALLAVGLEPGLAEMSARWSAEQLEVLDELALQCGGIPRQPVPPLGYRLLFDSARLPFEMRPTYCVEDGRLMHVPRFSGVELVAIEGIGKLEAFHDGLVPFLPRRPPFSAARRLTQKTLRWPGYADTVTTLHRLGLLTRTPVAVAGAAIAPEDFVYQVLAPQLRLRSDESDLVVLRAVASGTRAGRTVRTEVQIIDEGREGMTAMARTTGFTAALVARAIMEGTISVPTGAFWAEEVIHGAAFLALVHELRATGISIRCEGGAV